MQKIKMLHVYCRTALTSNCCEKPCSLIFPAGKLWKDRLRGFAKIMKDTCPMRKYGVIPVFIIKNKEKSDEAESTDENQLK